MKKSVDTKDSDRQIQFTKQGGHSLFCECPACCTLWEKVERGGESDEYDVDSDLSSSSEDDAFFMPLHENGW